MENELITDDPLINVVMDLLKSDEKDLAWKIIDHYFKKSTKLEHFDALGYLSLRAHKRETYLKCAEYSYALATTPDQLYIARANLYKAYNALNMPEKALFYVNQNLKITPEDFETRCHLAFNTSLSGDKITAEKILTDLIEKFPENAHKLEAAFSGKFLREGNTAKGILSFVSFFKPKNQLFEVHLGMKRWSGLVVPGKTIYVDVEGGIGDQIVNIRFFNLLKNYGMNPVLVSQDTDYYRDINQVFKRHGYTVLTDRILIDRNQTWVPMMNIPGYLGLTESKLWFGRYLTPCRNSKNKLSDTGKFKIGIKCSGNPFFAQDEYRKIPIENILNVLPENADIFYIDKEKFDHKNIINLSDRISNWEDTLDFIDQMDCIVSSCTSLVHAAGAMGKTTFVAVPIAEYYIWTTTKTDGSSPWYGENFYIARQKKVRDWAEPLNDIGHRVKLLLDKKL